jgi:hypothetical protein
MQRRVQALEILCRMLGYNIRLLYCKGKPEVNLDSESRSRLVQYSTSLAPEQFHLDRHYSTVVCVLRS